MKQLLTLIFLSITAFTMAQGSGSIVGKLTDKDFNNEPLAFANVIIKNTAKGTTSDIDGLYALENVEPGTYTVVYSFVGYETVEIPNVTVVANKVTNVNVPLGASAATLDEVVIKTTTKKESEVALLLEQKNAVTQKTSIGAQELSRKGVGDVATAVTKVTGISKEEGSGNVFVRGLGDRYNVTTLNGLPLPSDNPAKKNINLGIFTTDIVENIGIDKTYVPSNYGDFAGANIDITSKDYTGSGFMEFGFESGVNTITVGQKDFYLTDGPNRTGFYDINYPAFPLNNYNFVTSWDRKHTSLPFNSGFSLKGGDSYSIGDNSKLSFFGVGSFNNEFEYREGVSRGGVEVSAIPNSDFDYVNYAYNTNTTLMGNLGFKFNKQVIKYNGFYLNTTSEQQKEFYGIIDKDDAAQEGGGFIERSIFQRTQLFSHQLLGTHTIGTQVEVRWGGSYNYLQSDEPNRRQVTLLPDKSSEPEGPKSFRLISSSSENHRFYSSLSEEEIAGNFAVDFKFSKDNDDEYRGKVTLGYNGRFKNVDFDATQFNFRINNAFGVVQPIVEDIYNVDAYFNQQNLDAGLYRIETFRGSLGNTTVDPLLPQYYTGDQTIHAGYFSLEYKITPKFTVLAGVRGEQINQFIEWSTSIDPEGDESELDTFEILPALSLKYELNEKQNLKFAASKTYTLPQYKERAPFLFQEVNQDYFGNPFLYASTDYNVDLKWELFPASSEIISLGVFGKLIENPINTITVQSAANDISWANTGDQATAFGAEVEIRKTLLESEKDVKGFPLSTSLTAGLNAAYMITEQELDGAKVFEEAQLSFIPTYSKTGISGASDLIGNADISFFKELAEAKNIQMTLAANYFSDRIFALGNFGKGNIIEKGVPTLDFIFKTQLNENMTLGVSAKNLLNPSIERYQEAVDGETNNDSELSLNFQEKETTILSYKKGYDFKLTFAYKF
ncbi:MAG TPA: TonB-dependent receptor [Flavobacteriaceae bacterium]|nr:TonB-dependent receptor [Flavobacteriaceae bacterium]MCB9212191.1 TonB-dependent receptor [Alteromonas sp.]HPF10431.1 TonB-dependent receptor [Flavobacteriaceae bacterium]HQU20495.1 TonB-dependent receptor [Flavobacteriaceae bacterium]HQU64642.1 TonB-dependent receptor [Flavobacteriaceae bacterium]